MALKIIRIPHAPKSAFKKDRGISSLLKSQVEHVADAEKRLSRNKRTNVDVQSITTEHQAAEYVGTVMKHLLPKARKTWRLPPGKRAPKSGVWLGPAKLTPKGPAKRARTKTRKAGKKR
jgi:hypothetical protein